MDLTNENYFLVYILQKEEKCPVFNWLHSFFMHVVSNIVDILTVEKYYNG